MPIGFLHQDKTFVTLVICIIKHFVEKKIKEEDAKLLCAISRVIRQSYGLRYGRFKIISF